MFPSRLVVNTVALFFICNASPSVAYKILMLTTPAKSHMFPLLAIGDGLIARGHEVTVLLGRNMRIDITNDGVGQRVERYEDNGTDYEANSEYFAAISMDERATFKQQLDAISQDITRTCTFLLVDNEPLMERLDAHKFDLAVFDANFVFKCFYLIPHRLRIPFVTYTDILEPLLARSPWLPSFVPSAFLTHSERMSFFERLKNAAVMAAFSVISIVPETPAQILDDYRRLYGDFRSLDDLAARSLLWLYPRDHLVDYAKPTMPHIINVGGLTVRRSTGELPPEIKTFVEGARNGTIIVSFGSMTSALPEELIHNLLKAFRKLDDDGYRFVFRLRTIEGFDIPQNVMVSSWIPQNELLGHESVKLFITHCGNSGQYESVFQGQPMIGFPLFADQHYNANRMEYKGYGIAMNFRTFTPEELVQNVHRIIADRSYKDRVVKAARIFRNDPQSPSERASYWIEHVCRFGSDHLRSAGQDLPLYAYFMFDVLVFVLLVFLVAVFCVRKMSKCAIDRYSSKLHNTAHKREKLS